MNDQQTHKLEKAIQLIEDALRLQNKTDTRVICAWLNIAKNSCDRVAEELKLKKTPEKI